MKKSIVTKLEDQIKASILQVHSMSYRSTFWRKTSKLENNKFGKQPIWKTTNLENMMLRIGNFVMPTRGLKTVIGAIFILFSLAIDFSFGKLKTLKFGFSEKATKVWKNLPLVLTLLSKNSCFVKTGGRFFQILWPSHNVWT